jgi:aldose 1-epimerase
MTDTTVVLEDGGLRVQIDPANGCGVMGFWTADNDAWLALMPDAGDARLGLKASSFLMVPYSNRIEAGRFVFEGTQYQLKNGESHAIHGDVRQHAWVVEAAGNQQLRCRFSSADHSDINWPWAFEVLAEYTLEDGVFSSHLSLSNKADTPMPAGFGWHPYFMRHLTRKGEPVHLAFGVQSAYPDAHGTRIPSGPPQALEAHQDFSAEKELTPDNFLDTCFYGYDGTGHIAWPESGLRLHFDCSAACRHLILYNPEQPYFAVEPVTNANNGVNLYAQGDKSSGMQVLAPGGKLEADFSLRVEQS